MASASGSVRARARATREQLWSRIVKMDPAYAEYQRRTKRRLAVVVLDPI